MDGGALAAPPVVRNNVVLMVSVGGDVRAWRAR
jgi:hypothetical protein